MSKGKSGVPVKYTPPGSGQSPSSLAVLPLVVAGLAAVGRVANTGYKVIQQTSREASDESMRSWLREMAMAKPIPGGEAVSSVDSPDLSIQIDSCVSDMTVGGIQLDNVFNHLKEMSDQGRKSGLWVAEYRGEKPELCSYALGLEGKADPLVFAKNTSGQYVVMGAGVSPEILRKKSNGMLSLFYRNDLYYQLQDWGCKDVALGSSGRKTVITCKDPESAGQKMTIGINPDNCQVNFTGIPPRLMENVRKWLEKFSECRVTASGSSAHSVDASRGGSVSV